MNNGNNAAQGKHLESLATATKRYILAQILDVTDAVSSELENASGSGVLDTVPATVNGGMWYELDSGVPRYIKLKHGDHTLSLTPSIVNISPSLTVTPAASTIPVDGSITANVSFNGNGNITVTSDTINPTYNASTKVITVPYSYDVASATITVALSAGYGYLADSTTFNVTMAKASPNLTVTPSANTTDGDDITASVSYSGGGTLSVSSDNANVTPTVSGSTITIPYAAFDKDTDVTFTVSVSANGNYNAQSSTFSVLFEKCNNPELTVTPALTTLNLAGTTASVTRNGSGEISVASDNANVTPTVSGSTITIPYAAFDKDTDVTFTVSVAADSGYVADEKSFTVTYISPLVVNMPFNTSPTQDLCGNTWTAYGSSYGSPSIENKYLSLPRESYLINNSVTVGGKDLTVNGWCYMHAATGDYARVFEMAATDGSQTNILTFARNSRAAYLEYYFYVDVSASSQEFKGIFNEWFHFEVVYQHSAATAKCYINGTLTATITGKALSRVARKLRIGKSSWSSDGAFIGYIDDFKIYDGVALHTADFTPPARSST